MIRAAALAAVLVPGSFDGRPAAPVPDRPFDSRPAALAQDRQVTVHAQVISCKTGDAKKALPAGRLDKIARQLDEQTSHNHFEVVASASVRTEDGVVARVALGTAQNLSLSFKVVLGGSVQLAELVFAEEKDREVTTIAPNVTVKETRRVSLDLIRTRCTATDEEPLLVGIAGTGDGSLALVLRVSVK